jgi:N-acetylmuramoyl-L-alanine amidase
MRKLFAQKNDSRFYCCLLLCLSCLVGPLCVMAQEPTTFNDRSPQSGQKLILPQNFLVAEAKFGERGSQLLKRFKLNDVTCNEHKFLEINNLTEVETKLTGGKLYKLPIIVLLYNGKSIRSTAGLSDWTAAKRIEKYNRTALATGLREDDFVVSKKLWVPLYELEKCTEKKQKSNSGTQSIDLTEVEPASSSDARTYPIFGKTYAKTPLLSKRLKGRVFYVVSGHGGPDTGAQGKRSGRTLCEDEYAYDVSIRLLRLLISHGATAYMIVRDPNDGIRDEAFLACDYDEVVYGNLEIPRPQKERLQQRSDLINTFVEKNLAKGIENQTFVEIHVDSRSEKTETDVFFYYRPESEISRKLALRLQGVFESKYKSKQNGREYKGTVTSRYLHMLTETTVPKAVYVELANIQNDWDQQRLVLVNNRKALANWLFEGLTR